MKLTRYKHKHIFCIEGEWTDNVKDRATIHAGLEFLKSNADINFIRKYCATNHQFATLLTESLKQAYREFGIIYLAFHGSIGGLLVERRKKTDLNAIAAVLGGGATNKIIHFGSCRTMNLPIDQLLAFKEQTGAIAISGYTKDISFFESTVLDILYFIKCQRYRKVPLIYRDMLLCHKDFMDQLGFTMIFDE